MFYGDNPEATVTLTRGFDPNLPPPGERYTRSGEESFNPEGFGRFGMATRGLLSDTGGDDTRARVDARFPTVVLDDHLGDTPEDFATSSVVFRDLACPALDAAGNFAAVRPVVCQDGTVRTANFLPDHRTPCAAGSPDCEERVFSEPVLATGGSGYDPSRNMGLAPDGTPYSDMFGPEFRHICIFDSSGMISGVDDGRVAASPAVTMSTYVGHVYHWVASGDPSAGTRGQWEQGGGVGDGLAHGHDPDEGYYPRAGWYRDQNSVDGDPDSLVWFEPFSSYDNYGEVETAGDFGEDELIMRGQIANPGDLFVENPQESRVVYDEFVSTPVRGKGAERGLPAVGGSAPWRGEQGEQQ